MSQCLWNLEMMNEDICQYMQWQEYNYMTLNCLSKQSRAIIHIQLSHINLGTFRQTTSIPSYVLALPGHWCSIDYSISRIFSFLVWLSDIIQYGSIITRTFSSRYSKMFTSSLTSKQLEMHGCILSIVAIDALVFQLQAISWTNVDQNLCCYMASLGHNELTNRAVMRSNGI